MRRRIVQSTKVLSLAIAILPACDKVGAHAEPGPSASATAVSVAPSGAVSSTPSPELLNLAGELESGSREDALAKLDHYRPLCDAQGYPLVGNLPPKTMSGSKPMLPSELCAEVRKKPR